ncbi:unnamed protein product [Vitrella brassicaformis CCMP3155]|uniref:Uncharacterized protein n=1 Tax=Vitrella brassicaformis (strain CCMP3155) TaxID=1169540 RepID=A0A0G4EGZ4_VITBC|nr:unnamed protein product [Vitrella brassicaformis CCMP3155]|eukprot:CEL94743.1 unnamed protein product [Vitrella brassicaformis CCMP3155]
MTSAASTPGRRPSAEDRPLLEGLYGFQGEPHLVSLTKDELVLSLPGASKISPNTPARDDASSPVSAGEGATVVRRVATSTFLRAFVRTPALAGTVPPSIEFQTNAGETIVLRMTYLLEGGNIDPVEMRIAVVTAKKAIRALGHVTLSELRTDAPEAEMKTLVATPLSPKTPASEMIVGRVKTKTTLFRIQKESQPTLASPTKAKSAPASPRPGPLEAVTHLAECWGTVVDGPVDRLEGKGDPQLGGLLCLTLQQDRLQEVVEQQDQDAEKGARLRPLAPPPELLWEEPCVNILAIQLKRTLRDETFPTMTFLCADGVAVALKFEVHKAPETRRSTTTPSSDFTTVLGKWKTGLKRCNIQVDEQREMRHTPGLTAFRPEAPLSPPRSTESLTPLLSPTSPVSQSPSASSPAVASSPELQALVPSPKAKRKAKKKKRPPPPKAAGKTVTQQVKTVPPKAVEEVSLGEPEPLPKKKERVSVGSERALTGQHDKQDSVETANTTPKGEDRKGRSWSCCLKGCLLCLPSLRLFPTR